MRVLYISYDGLLDPLGHSQVLPYVTRLASSGIEYTIVSFEKPSRWSNRGARAALAEDLASRGIRWVPLHYHRTPRLPATFWDVLRGSIVVRREARRSLPHVLHARGDLAAAMGRWSGSTRTSRLLYDVRGFFSDERVESGSWHPGGMLDRLVRSVESRNLDAAAGIVVLTRAARQALTARRARPLPPHRVIPTCVDTQRFLPASGSTIPRFGLVYSGSLGSWYLGQEMLAFARVASVALGAPTLFLTPDGEQLRRLAAGSRMEVHEATPADVPSWLRLARAQFFFYQPSPARRATSPTKLGEGLACGLPVVCNRGIGDLDDLIEKERVGVVIDRFTTEAYEAAGARLIGLLADSQIGARCRSTAERVFDVRAGAEEYRALYDELAGKPGRAGRGTTGFHE